MGFAPTILIAPVCLTWLSVIKHTQYLLGVKDYAIPQYEWDYYPYWVLAHF
jgi:hypothetical protein